MIGYAIPAACQRCGGELEHDASGRPDFLGSEARAACHCSRCGARYALVVSLLFVSADECPHGNYNAHLRRGEKPCDEAKRAHTRRVLENEARKREAVRV